MVISIGNRKGGTGKTTTVVNLARALSIQGNDVLVIDLDPQANLSHSLGVHTKGCYLGETLLEQDVEDDYIYCSKGIDIIPSNVDLQEYEVEMIRSDYSLYCLKNALDSIKDSYDYILIDCPPAASLLTKIGLLASDFVLVPILFDYLGLVGLKQMETFIEQLNDDYNHNLKIIGAVGAMVDPRRKLITDNIKKSIVDEFEFPLFDSYIRLNVRVAEAPYDGVSVIDYAPNSNGAQDYINVANELKTKIKNFKTTLAYS